MLSMQLSDGCSWFPELWIHDCCVVHDVESIFSIDKADLNFLVCIAKQSHFLGPFAFIFAGLVVAGMFIGRPLRNFFYRNKG